MSTSHASVLVEEVLSGEQEQLKLLAAQGLMPLPADTLLELQVALTADDDPDVVVSARQSLAKADPQMVARYLAETERQDMISYFGKTSSNTIVLEQVVRRRDVSPALLGALAARAVPELQEILLQRQDVIVEHPELLDQLAANSELSSYSRRRIAEYREHLIGKVLDVEESAEPELFEDLEAIADGLTEEELEQEFEEVRGIAPKGEKDAVTGLTEAQVRALSMGARMRLTRGAQKTMRSILVRDANPIVAVSVVKNSPITEGEVEKIAGNRTIVIEVLEEIGRRRDWMRKYNVAHNLVRNPRAPLALSVRLVPRLSVRDLSNLARDRNVPDAVRKAAERLYRMKTT